MKTEFSEGLAKLALKIDTVASKELDVFYNPHMKHNRDISLCVMRQFKQKYHLDELNITLPLAGSGVRGVRAILEVPGVIACVNDKDSLAIQAINTHISLNGVDTEKITVSQLDACEFLLKQKRSDYIDIDPFGSPNPFLDSAVRMLKRGGILAITATDTAPLCGAYPSACKRKYDAVPHNGSMCQEIGLRILIRKVQVIGSQYDKALVPILSYPKDHYMRVYFVCTKSKTGVDEILAQHQFLNIHENQVSYDISPLNKEGFAGPLYVGKLFDATFCDESFFADLAESTSNKKWVEKLALDVQTNLFGYYDIHSLAQVEKIENMPNFKSIVSEVTRRGFVATRTAFNYDAIRTNMPYDAFVGLVRDISVHTRS